ncbi:response regulator [Chromobacterium sp. Rain0013]|uniref:ATP-binding protein n=1 Tax=Chromobacterium sp. Rain0013 TaxID=2292447 RepID=UPI0018875814|nr:ATP-binding protein [Chromobacterium sp. Rain0013]QOZ83744.1 response regulator [Chromobacterium sp. Rain0013]
MFFDFVEKIDAYLNKKLKNYSIETTLQPYGWRLSYTQNLDLIKHGAEAGIHWLFLIFLLISLILLVFAILIEKKILKPSLISTKLLEDTLILNDKLFQLAPVGLYVFEKNSNKELKSNASAKEFLKNITETEKNYFFIKIADELNKISNQTYTGQITFQTLLNEEVVWEVKAVEIKQDNFPAIFCVLRDISEIIKKQKALNTLALKADASNKAKSLFLATISHEIRTPLGSVINGLELLSYSTLTKAQKNQLDLVAQSSLMLYALINDILDFSKLEAGSISIKKELCDARTVVEMCVQRLLHMAKNKALDIFCFIDPKFPAEVSIDQMRFEQIINNLLSNAIKFTEKGRVAVFLNFHKESDGDGIIYLKVADTGIGISPQEKEKLFQPFVQIENELQNYHPGTGLGLSICSKLTELLHGKLKILSEVGLGTSVTVSIPAEMQTGQVEKKLQGISVGLLLSNDFEFQYYVKELLESFGAFAVLINSNDIPNDLDVLLCDEKKEYREKEVDIVLSQNAPLQPDWNENPIYVSFFSREAIVQSIRVAAGLDLLESSSEVKKDFSKVNQSLKVLVAEDHVISQQIIKQQLELLNQTVFIVGNGKEALSVLSKKKIDLILTDIHMPVMNGFELSALVQSLDPAPPVYGMTADLNEEVQFEAEKAGMSSCFSKPLNLDQLAGILKTISENMFVPTQIINQGFNFDEKTSAALKEDILFLDAALSANDQSCFISRLHSLVGALSVMGASTTAIQAEKLLKKSQISNSFVKRADWESLKENIIALLVEK